MNDEERIRDKVREGYGAIAETGGSCCGSGTGCGCGGSGDAAQLAEAIGYDTEELAALPEGANMGLSCGNPVALASLKPGEVVVDLGSGGGFDVFIAGRKVGAEGRAIGVDMTPQMLSRARQISHRVLSDGRFPCCSIGGLPGVVLPSDPGPWRSTRLMTR